LQGAIRHGFRKAPAIRRLFSEPANNKDMVAAALRSVFVQAEAQAVEQQWD
jgi:hypothetical protein